MYASSPFRFNFILNAMCFSAIAIYNPPDVHPILKAYEGKDVPLEYAKTEADGSS